jgi:hypothetical protein
MARPARDQAREERIENEIIVDAYDSEEQSLGWYYYLEGKLQFPFTARCVIERASSPLLVGDEVEVVGMPSEDECEHEMLVNIRWDRRTLAVPLAQLQAVAVDDHTQEAIEDWPYWLAQGYEF